MEELTDRRKISGIKRGSYHRILNQAKNSIKESVFTVAFAVQLGLLRLEDVQKIISSGSAIPEDADPAKASEALALLAALMDKLVMA